MYMQYIHLISLTLIQNNQNGEHIEKAKRICRTHDIY